MVPVLRPERYEVALPAQYPPGHTRPATRVRSTLLAASVQGLREMGWEARYFAALPSERHLELRMLTAGTWMPLELGVTHYRACDAMGLTSEEMDRMGENVSLRTQKSFVGMLGRAAAGAGATPWTIIGNVHRIYGRMIDGADHCIYRVGPKEALIVNVGCPLVEIPYFRTAMIAYYRAAIGVVASTVYANEVPRYRKPLTVGVQVAWV
jgi:hypothetical protein